VFQRQIRPDVPRNKDAVSLAWSGLGGKRAYRGRVFFIGGNCHN
jgi:hypothetical protein